MQGMFGVDANGRNGDLGMLWKEEVRLDLLSFSRYNIDMRMTYQEGKMWRLIEFYREPDARERHQAWSMLWRLASNNSLPWICLRGFNEILWVNEKEGGNARLEGQMRAFRNTLIELGFYDLGYTVPKFTLKCGQNAENAIGERLDWAVACSDWGKMLPNYLVRHLASLVSDYCPRMVDTMGKLEEINHLDNSQDELEKELDIKRMLNKLLEHEEVTWMQRSRENWLRSGDKNTKFFHAQATQRSRANRINGLKDEARGREESGSSSCKIFH
ncbi:uncharacterized protein LOC111288975 [Durio zibethinus]|uniref:Uncharacterized protein LOC111288975 n=1 Tax=Durio zibethinus TaxID=66656 RepID=A0A6P5Y5A3_DURZI|nr:uncharacterized protein LOC111288975 [Durio zibethinus]